MSERRIIQPTADEAARGTDKSSLLYGEDLDLLFGRKAEFVRGFVMLLNSKDRFFGVKLPIAKAETKTTSKYFGLKVHTEVIKEPTYIKGYNIGQLQQNGLSSGSVYLCQDAVVREFSYSSGLLKVLEAGELSIGLEKVTAKTYYNRDSRAQDSVNVTRAFVQYTIEDILTKYAFDAMTAKLEG